MAVCVSALAAFVVVWLWLHCVRVSSCMWLCDCVPVYVYGMWLCVAVRLRGCMWLSACMAVCDCAWLWLYVVVYVCGCESVVTLCMCLFVVEC